MTESKTSVHNVICIDDNQVDYFIFQKQLKLSGFIGNILYYSNPLQALEHLKENLVKFSPDIFIVDYNMPDMDGLECIDKIKTMASAMLPESMIQYVLYSIGNKGLYESLLKKSGIGFIEKPIDSSMIQILLKNLDSSEKVHKYPLNHVLEKEA